MISKDLYAKKVHEACTRLHEDLVQASCSKNVGKMGPPIAGPYEAQEGVQMPSRDAFP